MSERIAVITGGSRGLGRSAAIHLARQGVGSVVTYHSRADAAQEAVREIQAAGAKAVALKLDVGRVAQFPAFVEELKGALSSTWGRTSFDFLFNNAGHGVVAPFAETSEADFDELANVHFKGPYFLSQKLLPLIADGGRILNVSSGLTRFSVPGYAAYSAMKGAVEVMTRFMAKELGERKISVNTLAPGAIETDFGGGAIRDTPEINGFLASNTALGRVGLPEDIGGVVASLLTSSSNWINGERIEASGGMFL